MNGRTANAKTKGLLRYLAPRNDSISRRRAEFRDDDIFITSFPRSGNTWLRLMLADAIMQRAGIRTDTRLPVHQDKIIPNVEANQPLDPDPRFKMPARLLKTHAEYRRTMKRAIVILRRPADCLCSYYHFHLRYDYLQEFAARGVDEFCRRQMKRWKAHAAAYIRVARRHPQSIFLTSYEQLYFDPVRILRAIGEFIGLPLSHTICRTAVDNHSFDKQRQLDRPRGRYGEYFYRRGEIDSARGELSADTYRQVNAAAFGIYAQASKRFTVSLVDSAAPRSRAA